MGHDPLLSSIIAEALGAGHREDQPADQQCAHERQRLRPRPRRDEALQFARSSVPSGVINAPGRRRRFGLVG